MSWVTPDRLSLRLREGKWDWGGSYYNMHISILNSKDILKREEEWKKIIRKDVCFLKKGIKVVGRRFTFFARQLLLVWPLDNLIMKASGHQSFDYLNKLISFWDLPCPVAVLLWLSCAHRRIRPNMQGPWQNSWFYGIHDMLALNKVVVHCRDPTLKSKQTGV